MLRIPHRTDRTAQNQYKSEVIVMSYEVCHLSLITLTYIGSVSVLNILCKVKACFCRLFCDLKI